MQMEEKIRKLLIYVLEVVAMMLLYTILDSSGIFKYIVLSAVGGGILVIKRKDAVAVFWDKILWIPIVLYCVLGMCFFVIFQTYNAWTLKTIIFWIFPFVIALAISLIYRKNYKRMLDIQFYGCVLTYLPPVIVWLFMGGKAESTFAFVFGLFALYYLWNKNILNFSLAILLAYFANKRIVILSVCACILLMILMKILKYASKWIYAFWSMLIVGSGIYLFSIRSGYLKRICEWAQIDTKWRLYIYEKMFAQGGDSYYLGQGTGMANVLLAKSLEFEPWLYAGYENPHNDLLKIYIELGVLGLALFLFSYLVVFKISEKKITQRALSQLFVICVYFVLLMTTDNVSVYILFLVPMHSICLALMGEKKENEDEYHAK